MPAFGASQRDKKTVRKSQGRKKGEPFLSFPPAVRCNHGPPRRHLGAGEWQ